MSTTHFQFTSKCWFCNDFKQILICYAHFEPVTSMPESILEKETKYHKCATKVNQSLEILWKSYVAIKIKMDVLN